MLAAMDSATRFEKATICLATVSALALAVLFQTSGKGLLSFLIAAFLVIGLLGSIAAAMSSLRPHRPAWFRWLSATALVAFGSLAAWAAYLVTHVPFS